MIVGPTGAIQTNPHILVDPNTFPHIAESANAVREGALVLDLSTKFRKAFYGEKVPDPP